MMHDRRLWGFAALAIALLIALLVLFKSSPPPEKSRPTAKAPASDSVSSSAAPQAAPTPVDPRRVTALEPDADGRVLWPGAVSQTETINQPDQSASEDIAAIHTMLADYLSVFGEVPEGGLNEEITRGLLGDNQKKIIFLAAKPGMLDDSGALLDRWGTPYFFHKLSRKIINLRSAGPDRKLWTGDDIFEVTEGGPPL